MSVFLPPKADLLTLEIPVRIDQSSIEFAQFPFLLSFIKQMQNKHKLVLSAVNNVVVKWLICARQMEFQ